MLDRIDQEQTAADAPAIEPQAAGEVGQAEGLDAQIPAAPIAEIPAATEAEPAAEQPDEAERAILRAYTDHTKHHEA